MAIVFTAYNWTITLDDFNSNIRINYLGQPIDSNMVEFNSIYGLWFFGVLVTTILFAFLTARKQKQNLDENKAIADFYKEPLKDEPSLLNQALSWSGGIYTGQMKKGIPHGQGIWILSSKGFEYIGNWRDGKYHGQGAYKFLNGTEYTGGFNNGMRQGQGTCILPDGSKYIGKWKNDKLNGQGIFAYIDGTKYIGEWEDDKRHGQGIYTYPDGRALEGEWEYGKFNKWK